MLPQYLSGKLDVPPEVTIVWTDDNDGHMRALPRAKDQWKHGVNADAARILCYRAYDDLELLEGEIRRAERPPFERWYGKTWIRDEDSPYNVHRSFERTREFLIAHDLKP